MSQRLSKKHSPEYSQQNPKEMTINEIMKDLIYFF